jgi:chloramphenicol 3-O-phosphotransferase
VLRAASTALNLDECLEWAPPELLTRTWRVGDRRSASASRENNGFILLLSDAESGHESFAEARQRIEMLSSQLRKLVSQGINLHVDLAMYVTARAPARVVVPTVFIQTLLEHGIAFVVSAFPCSAEDND